jgi:hypothetical protein
MIDGGLHLSAITSVESTLSRMPVNLHGMPASSKASTQPPIQATTHSNTRPPLFPGDQPENGKRIIKDEKLVGGALEDYGEYGE